MFDPRLTEEYQVAGEPWSKQTADGEIQAMAIGAALWSTANQQNDGGRAVMKTRHIGCRYGYVNLKWKPKSPMFSQAGASGLTIGSWQDVILVNQAGLRFWNEMDESYAFRHAAMGTNGNLGKDEKPNGGGPIWAIFDADAVTREKWDPNPPNVDLERFLFQCGHAGRTRRQDQEHVPASSDAGQRAGTNRREVQLIRRRGQGHGVWKTHAHVQNSETTLLRGVVDADTS